MQRKLSHLGLEEIVSYTEFDIFKRRMQKKLRAKKEVSGAELIVYSLEALAPENPGIEMIAGHHGGAILPFFEFYSKSELYKGYIHSPTEQVAGFVANGIAKHLNGVGVAVVTSGPGATNAITPFYDSNMDSVPVVFLSGNVSTAAARTKAFQEAPIVSMIADSSKQAIYVGHAEQIPDLLYYAFRMAKIGSPGPVWVDVPKDVQLRKMDPNSLFKLHDDLLKNFRNKYHVKESYDLEANLSKVIELIGESRRPILYIGGGVRSAAATKELQSFANYWEIPVTTTLMGKGVFPETHKLSLGMLGMHGTAYANYAVNEADLVINIGARYDDRVVGDPSLFAKDAIHVHIDQEPKAINEKLGRNPHLMIQTDAKKALEKLLELSMNSQINTNYHAWHKRIDDLKTKFPLGYDGRNLSDDLAQGPLKPQWVIERIYDATEGNWIMHADVGQHQMWTAQYYRLNSPDWNTSGGSGTMGISMPAAFGTWMASRYSSNKKPMGVIVGDESFMMNIQALELYYRYNADIKVFVLDNKAPNKTPGGMVRQWYDSVHEHTQINVKDGVPITRKSEGFGVPALYAENRAQAREAIGKALVAKGPVLVHFKVDPFEDCLPMVPSGKSVADMVLYAGK